MRPAIVMPSVLALACAVAPAAADEPVAFDKLPPVIVEKFQARWGQAENIVCTAHGDQDDRTYRIAFVASGRRCRAEFAAVGVFRGSVETVKAADLPAAVRDTVLKRYPGALIVTPTQVTSGEGAAAKVVYRLKSQTEEERRAFVIAASGKLLEEKLLEDGDSADRDDD